MTRPLWIYGAALALVNSSGCALLRTSAPVPSPSVASPSGTLSGTPFGTSSPAPSADSTETLVPFAVLTAPSFLSPAAPTATRESYACLTANYFANLNWQQDQPRVSFGRKPQQGLVQQVARRTGNPDGSFTYEVAENPDSMLYYMRVYPDRSCLLQVVEKNSGKTNVEESGSLGGLVTGQTSPDYRQGYDKGYQIGYDDGRRYYSSGFGNQPDQAFGRGAQTGKADYDWGYREGFYAGFDKGHVGEGG